jgi:hypothetical protein
METVAQGIANLRDAIGARQSKGMTQHRLADAAWDDSLDRKARESVKQARQDRGSAALIALLRTKPEKLAGALAALRYIADWADNNDAGLFHGWSGPLRPAGIAFLPMIADVIEAATRAN